MDFGEVKKGRRLYRSKARVEGSSLNKRDKRGPAQACDFVVSTPVSSIIAIQSDNFNSN